MPSARHAPDAEGVPPSRSALASAKADCRRAYQGAKHADPVRGALFDRPYVEIVEFLLPPVI